MLFVQVPEDKFGKNRIHLDLIADDIAVEAARLVELGATVVHEKTEWGHHWITLQDPEGNEFCVAQTGAEQTESAHGAAVDHAAAPAGVGAPPTGEAPEPDDR